MFFDTVIVCSVTGSTQAGMIAGFAGTGAARGAGHGRFGDRQQTWDQIAGSPAPPRRRSGSDAARDDEIVLLDEWHAGTYGIPDEKTIDAIRLCARLEGMLTDPVYEGKSMAALIDLVRGGRIEPGSRVLYAHLGGQPALNAYAGRSSRESLRRRLAPAAAAAQRSSWRRMLSGSTPRSPARSTVSSWNWTMSTTGWRVGTSVTSGPIAWSAATALSPLGGSALTLQHERPHRPVHGREVAV